jgi:hypothetical protein
MSKLFIIRDDDLSYFSKREDIDFWYKDLFLENIPVSFSAIPFVKGSSDVYVGSTAEKDKEYPIGENLELVQYLKDNLNNIEIMQHGCTHETIDGIYEFERKSGLFKETKRGFEYLNNIFGKIGIFVAPHDSISNHGIKAVEFVGLNIIRSKGFRNIIFRFKYFIGIFKMVIHRIKNFNRFTASAYPYVVDLGGHKEAYSHRLIKDKDLLQKWLIYSASKNSNFIIVNHLHDRDNEAKQILFLLIKQAKDLGFSFVKASDIFKYEN